MKRFFKKVGYSLLGLLAILLAISLLLPTEQLIERRTKINAPMQIVFENVNDMRNWERWSPWKKMDPTLEMSYSNPPAGKGAYFHYKSANPDLGTGKVMITEVVPQKKIVVLIDPDKGQDLSAEFAFAMEKEQVKVTWSAVHHVTGGPVAKYKAMFQKGARRNLFEQGLLALKEISENR